MRPRPFEAFRRCRPGDPGPRGEPGV